MRHNEKSENIARGRRLLVVASQTVGVVAVHRPHRRPNPFISGQSFHFQMTGALGDTMLIPLSLTVRVLRREQIVTSATRRANREEKNMVKENNEVSRCKTAGALLHRDCWRNRDEAVRQRLGRDSRLAAVAHTRAVTTTHRALRKSMLPSPARTKERREQSAKKNRDGPRWPDRPGKAEEKNRSWGSYPKARRKNEEMKNRKKKRRLKRTVESLIPPHVVPWLVDIWIGTGCSKTKMHLTAFCNAWACQPTCIQFSENIVIGVEKPGECEKTEKSREKLRKRMWTNAKVCKTCKA